MLLIKRNFSAFVFMLALGLFMVSCKDEDLSSRNANVGRATLNMLTDNTSSGTEETECFAFVYPIEVVFPDGTNATVNSDDDLETTIDNWYDGQGANSDEYPTFTFPISIVLEDGTEQTIQNEEELIAVFEDCYGDFGESCGGGKGNGCDDDENDSEVDCFTFVFPVEINFADGTQVTVNSDEELYELEENWDESTPEPTLTYPVTAILEDGTQQVINNDEEMDLLWSLCGYDDYEECFDVNFPISIIQNGNTITINNEEELDALFEGTEDFELVYPITVTLEDGSTATANNDDELENLCNT